jgi:phage/plasmid-like protein (TIGR03299 family)
MAHLIDFTSGKAGMAYVGEKPWHGLGQELSRGASIDQWRVEAGLNWNVNRAQVQFVTNEGPDETFHKGESEILYRSDSFAQLGIVTDRYKVVQPSAVLEFFRDIVGVGGMELETAGSLDGGRKVWALAHTGDEFAIKGQDRIGGYLLLSTSFDGSMATRAQFTSVRVVCDNTLQIAARDTKGAIKIPHSTDFDAHGVKIDLGLLNGAFGHFEEQANALADRSLSNAEAMKLLISVMAPEAKEADEISTKKFNQIKTIFDLYTHAGMGSSLASSKGTAWGLVNAMTEYVDHTSGNNANNRFRSAQFGPGAQLKDDVFAQALKLVA